MPRHGKRSAGGLGSAFSGTWIGYALANVWCYALGVMVYQWLTGLEGIPLTELSRDQRDLREVLHRLHLEVRVHQGLPGRQCAVVGQQPFGGARRSGTNDKAGSILNLDSYQAATLFNNDIHTGVLKHVWTPGEITNEAMLLAYYEEFLELEYEGAMIRQSSFLPLKVNYSGVMPVIFASEPGTSRALTRIRASRPARTMPRSMIAANSNGSMLPPPSTSPTLRPW